MRRAVDQQIRQPRGQHQRLFLRAVVVGPEVHRLLVDIGQHFMGDLGETDFRVTHGRGAVAVNGAEVPLTIYQHVAQREILRHAHNRVVHRAVAVRVVLTNHVTHDTRRFLVWAIPVVVELMHRKQHPAVHGLETVAGVGQGSAHDHAHRVIKVTAAHLLF